MEEGRADYRMRIIVKFRQDWKSLDVRTQAQYRLKEGDLWVTGWDSLFNDRAVQFIQGRLGRVVR